MHTRGGVPLSDREQRLVLPSDADHRLWDKLATACRILGTEGHNDTVYGHISARSASAERFWLKGAGLGLEAINSIE